MRTGIATIMITITTTIMTLIAITIAITLIFCPFFFFIVVIIVIRVSDSQIMTNMMAILTIKTAMTTNTVRAWFQDLGFLRGLGIGLGLGVQCFRLGVQALGFRVR